MAPASKSISGPAVAAPVKPQTSNGVITDGPPPAVNRKKQKRRQKQAARQATVKDQHGQQDYASDDYEGSEHAPPHRYTSTDSNPARPDLHYGDAHHHTHDHYEGADGTDFAYSDEENHYQYDPAYQGANGVGAQYQVDTGRAKKASKKKKKTKTAAYDPGYDDAHINPPGSYPQPAAHAPTNSHPPSGNYAPPAISDEALRTVQSRVNDPIWDTSTQEERSRIKGFWLALGEDDRKSLVKIEKEAVLRKMKEQQKHSCSCTVCGRKRTAIEEELEVLYDAYYEELEQYANHGQRRFVDDMGTRPLSALDSPTRTRSSQGAIASHAHDSSRNRVEELPDDGDDDPNDEVDDEEYSEDPYDAEGYSGDDTDSIPPQGADDFFAFGRSLTVKGGILTVADDLLKNDGQKFIDMMEQLAERRMQRESQAYAPYSNAHRPPPAQYPPGHDYIEDEEEDDEDADYLDDDDYGDEDEEDDTVVMNEAERMEEGRRMFQIFAARMFEQRVLAAYREKRARDLQDKLLEELDAESRADTQRDAKKARDAEKKKLKKQQQKQKQAEEKARKEEAKAAAEAAAREAEAKKQEEQRLKREEQRKKKEAERKALEDEKQRKEAEKQRRQQEERNRQQEAERKAREAKAEEKRRKDEAKRKEREEKEAKEQSARDKKAQEDKFRQAKDERARPDAEAQGKRRKDDQTQTPQVASASVAEPIKRASLSAAVAVPPGLKSQKPATNQPSPQMKVATPVVPKASTPVRNREVAGHSPDTQTPENSESSKQSTPPRQFAGPSSSNATSAPASRTPSRQPQIPFPPQMSPSHGMSHPSAMAPTSKAPASGFGAAAVNGYPAGQMPIIPGIHQNFGVSRSNFPSTTGQMAHPGRQQGHASAGFPPGMNISNAPGLPSRGFGQEPPASIASRTPSVSAAVRPPHATTGGGSHSRQVSSSFDTAVPSDNPSLGPSTQPIARPAPIKRPESTKPGSNSADVDDLSSHLGSSALLGDDDEAIPSGPKPHRGGAALGMPQSAGTGLIGSPFESTFGHFSGGSLRGHNAFGPPPLQSTGWGAPSAGWPTNMSQRSGNRFIQMRQSAVQVCQRFGQVTVQDLLRQVNSLRGHSDTIHMQELQSVLETEGDHHNGGGNFSFFSDAQNRVGVKWDPSNGHAISRGPGPGLGEIGSPIPGNHMPAVGGRPF